MEKSYVLVIEVNAASPAPAEIISEYTTDELKAKLAEITAYTRKILVQNMDPGAEVDVKVRLEEAD